MDLYVVDGNYVKTTVVDEFDSLIWTERYNSSGDVTVTLPATSKNRSLIKENIFLHMPDSREIMLIDTISIEQNILKATGNTLVDFLRNRMFRARWQTDVDAWNLLGHASAGQAMNAVMQVMAIPGTYLTDGTVLTSAQGTNETFPQISLVADVAGPAYDAGVPYGNLYDGLKTIGDTDNLGFSLYPPSVADGTGNLRYLVYRGLDRTSTQTTNEQVIFDSAMDSLANTKELRSIQNYKNVAWVWPAGATAQSQIVAVYATGASGLTGFQRRSMMVEATDVNAPDYTSANLIKMLTQRGKDALANNNYVRTLDGQIVPQSAYKYGVNYNLGDIIELRGPSGSYDQARVTEYIRSQDSTGETAYPTLSVIS